MSYLSYLCLFTYSGVQHISCCVFSFVCLRFLFCVPNVPSFSGLSILFPAAVGLDKMAITDNYNETYMIGTTLKYHNETYMIGTTLKYH